MLRKELYPFESHFLGLNGLRYHYVDEGQGPAVVMLHGNPSWSFYYRDLIKALRPRFRVIAPDHIGMGLSDKPDDSRYKYTAAQRLDDVGKLIDHLALPSFTLVGHDWGGIIGTAYAALHPEKIDGMVLLNTAGFNWPVNKRLPIALFLSRIPLTGALLIRGLNAFARGAVSMGMKRGRMRDEVAEGLLHPYGSWADRIAVHRFIQDIPMGSGDPGYDLGLLMESRLKLLRDVPKMFCWGMKDFVFCSKVLDEWMRFFPDADVHRFEDAGHYILEDAAAEVIPLVQSFIETKVRPGARAPKRSPATALGVAGADVTERILEHMRQTPNGLAVAEMKGLGADGKGEYATLTYGEADRDSSRIAHGLEKVGLRRGMRVVVMVKPGTQFFSILVAILKAGAIPVLVDPGMGMARLKTCLQEARPEAFIGIPRAQIGRLLFRWARETLKIIVTVGARRGWGGYSLEKVKSLGSPEPYHRIEHSGPDDMVMLAYTSGNTGAPKGVIFTQRMLTAQIAFLQQALGLRPGDAHLATFPPFALFAPACGATAVIPEMDATKPASADPRHLIAALNDYHCTSTFCSPALVEKIGRYCEASGVRLPELRQVVSAGAPARLASIARFAKALGPDGKVVVFYGATEALPLTSIDSTELLQESRQRTDDGGGACVGRTVEGVQIAIVKITEEALPDWVDTLRLPPNQIGEIVAKGPFVSPAYYNLPERNRLAKIRDPRDGQIWHRMGDVGYLDEQGRLWMCGRKAHRVEAHDRTYFSLPCEAIFNRHEKVDRSALVGVSRNGKTEPVICIQLEPGVRLGPRAASQLTSELLELARAHEITRTICTILYHPKFPVDVRHNSKILREKLALWAQKEIG